MYEKIKRFYDLGLYREEQIERFFNHGYITREEMEKILEGTVR